MMETVIMVRKNKIKIILTLLLNVLPWIIANKIVTNPSINSPSDPEGVLVVLFFLEIASFVIWLCWLLFLLFMNKNNLSLLIIGIINLPYVIFYGYGQISIINLLFACKI